MDKYFRTKEMENIINSRNRGSIGTHYHLYKQQEDMEFDFDFGSYIINCGLINPYKRRKSIDEL